LRERQRRAKRVGRIENEEALTPPGKIVDVNGGWLKILHSA